MSDPHDNVRETHAHDDGHRALQDALARGQVDALGRTAAAALGDPATSEHERARWLRVLPSIADEVSTTSLAATIWLHVARARTPDDPTGAFDAVARAFAYEPDREETLDTVRALVDATHVEYAGHARGWLAGLVIEGMLPRAECVRFDHALTASGSTAPTDDTRWSWALRASTADDVQRLLQHGVHPLADVIVARYLGVSPMAPEAKNVYRVVVALRDALPPSPLRGRISFVEAWFSPYGDGDLHRAFEIVMRSLADLPDHEPTFELVEQLFAQDPDLHVDRVVQYALLTHPLEPSCTARLAAAIAAGRARGAAARTR